MPDALAFLEEAPSAESFLDDRPSVDDFLGSVPKTRNIDRRNQLLDEMMAEQERGQAASELANIYGKPEELWHSITTPLIDVAGRVTPKQVQDAYDYSKAVLTGGDPGSPSRPPSTIAQVVSGAQDAAAGGVNSMTSPLGIATLGTGTLSQPAQQLVSAIFAGQMASQLPEQAGTASVDTGDTAQNVENIGNTLVSALMTATAGRHATEVPPVPIKPPNMDNYNAWRQIQERPAGQETAELLKQWRPDEIQALPKETEVQAEKPVEPVQGAGPVVPAKEEVAAAPARLETNAGNITETKPVEIPSSASKSTIQPEIKAVHADEFIPALRKSDGIIIEGQKGQVHDDIYNAQGKEGGLWLRVEQPEHGFVREGKFYSREEASAALGEKEPLQSQRLKELQSIKESSTGEPKENSGTTTERVRLKGSPQTYTVVDRPESTPLEKSLGESTVRVKNERTGEIQIVNESQVQAVKPKWTSATAPGMNIKINPKAGEAGFVDVGAIAKEVYEMAKKAKPAVMRGISSLKRASDEVMKLPPKSDIRKNVLNWSSRLQRSFNESAQAQKEIIKRVPDKTRREGITNWIQAGGDKAVLMERAKNSSNPKIKAGYDAALNLTPDEISIAQEVKDAFDELGNRGKDNDVLSNFRENYTPQIWDLKKGPVFSGAKTLRENFRFAKARKFESFFEGEQAGYVPKTKDISQLLPVYLHEMNSVIAARKLVEEMSHGTASDGLPLVRTRGSGVQVENQKGGATLVLPDASKASDVRYRTLPDQPALHDWKWIAKDSESGKSILMKGDVELHPEAYEKLKNILGQSAIREWYNSPGSVGAAIPKSLVKGLDLFQSETKRTMLGMIAPFHQVQEGTHAVGHRVNPFFNIPKIDLVGDARQIDATQHGLMLAPDRTSANQFMEGVRTSGLVSKIPIFGKVADYYSDYLFHQYIPGLKFKTYEAILERNNGVYKSDLASGKVTPEDVKMLSAQQANAAYGHLNYSDLGRNPTIQHIMQMGLLAPDFLEARARFAGQALKGTAGGKIGREQMIALATLALAQAATSWTAAQLSGGEWDSKHPFEFHVGDRKYTMRSVPEDIAGLSTDWRRFLYSRISPVYGKASIQLMSGVDWAGNPISPGKTLQQAATQFVPLNLRGMEWVKDFTGENRPGSLSPLEQLAGSMGLRVSRYSAQSEVYQLAKEYRKANNLPTGHFVSDEPSDNSKLRNALLTKDQAKASEALEELRKSKTDSQIFDAFGKVKPFRATGNIKDESKFKASFGPEDQRLYDEALRERESERQYFLKIWHSRPARKNP